jgi:hypothetical protein
MSTQTNTMSLAAELETLLANPPAEQHRRALNSRTQSNRVDANDVTEEATLALLQQSRILASERANVTIREALNEKGATLHKCAEVLSFIIQNVHERADVRRRAVADVLLLHNAAPTTKVEPAPQTVQIMIQTSDKVNLANVLNPSLQKRDPMETYY